VREANFLTSKSQLVTVALPQGTPITSNKIKLYFTNSNTNNINGKLVNRIRFFGFDNPATSQKDLSKVNGITVAKLVPDPAIYITLKDRANNVLLDSANLYDFAQQCNNVDGAGRPIYAPVRRLSALVHWPNSYITLTTTTPYSSANIVLAMQVSYTNPN
jgi:uncharacterized membrane protein